MDLSQSIIEDLRRFADELKEATQRKEFGRASLIIGYLTTLQMKVESLKDGEVKEKKRTNKKKQIKDWDSLSEYQITLFNLILEQRLGLGEAVRTLHPHLKEVRLSSNIPEYDKARRERIKGLKKIKGVLSGEVDVESLSKSNQDFYKELRGKIPETTYDKAREIFTSRTYKKRKTKKA